MGFMDFLKKTKKDVPMGADLDVPPPPPLPNSPDAFPAFPTLDNSAQQISRPPMQQPQMRSPMPKMPSPQEMGAQPFPVPPKVFDDDVSAAENDIFGQPFSSAESDQNMKQNDMQQTAAKPAFPVSDSMPGLASPEELGLEHHESYHENEFASDNSIAAPKGQMQSGPLEIPPRLPAPSIPTIDDPVRQQQAALTPPKIEEMQIQRNVDIKADAEEDVEEMEEPPKPSARARPKDDIFAREVREAKAQIQRRMPTGPLFIRMTDFREVLERTDSVKAKVKEALDTVDRVSRIDTNKTAEYEKWRKNIADLQKMTLLVDKKIFELEG